MKPSVAITPYRTKSIELVAFLMFKGHKLCGKTEEDRYHYAVFVDTDELKDDVQSFYNGNDAKRLFDELRNAKQYLMDSEYRRG